MSSTFDQTSGQQRARLDHVDRDLVNAHVFADDPVVDVVVLTWNDGHLLRAAADSALDSRGVRVRLLVVDNASDTPLDLPIDDRVIVIRNDMNRGVAAGRNQGIADGSAPWICVLDSDARLEPDSLRTMIDILGSSADLGLVGPVFVDQTPGASAGRAPTLWTKVRRALNLTDSYDDGTEIAAPALPATTGQSGRDVDFVIGACQVLRRTVYESVGGIDETYFYGPEDVDFCLRIRRDGWRVRQVEAPVHHPPRRRNRSMFTRRGVAHGRAVVRHLWRHRDTRRHLARLDADRSRREPRSAIDENAAIDVQVVLFGDDRLPAIAATLQSARRHVRLVAIDHSPGSASPARIASPSITLVNDPTNPGFGSGQNSAARLGDAPLLLLLNPDAAVDWEAVEAGVDALVADPRRAAVQGGIVTASTGVAERAGGREFGPLDLWGRALGARRLLDSPTVVSMARRLGVMRHQTDRGATRDRPVETLAATALLVRRDAFEAVGGFSERYFLYGEDLDLCRRLRADGWILWELERRWAVHECGASAGADGWAARERHWWTGTMRFCVQWWPTHRAVAALSASALMAARISRTAHLDVTEPLVAEPARSLINRERQRRGERHRRPAPD